MILKFVKIMKILSNNQLIVKISTHGAELNSINYNRKEYLWQADPVFWKRHAPILFPIVGKSWEDKNKIAGKNYMMTQHGFARDMEFVQIFDRTDEARFLLNSNEETLKKYPFPFRLEIGYRLQGNQIHVQWTVKNTGDKEMHFQIGAHPAFYFPDFDTKSVEKGFFGFNQEKDLKYILIADKGCVDTQKEYPLKLNDDHLLAINTSTFNNDALVFQNSQIKKVTLYDKNRKPYLEMQFNAPVVGLWSPAGKNAPFVCIEPWYGRCDSINFKGEFEDKDWMQHLEPRSTFTASYVIKILS